jgi:hypothetical protein
VGVGVGVEVVPGVGVGGRTVLEGGKERGNLAPRRFDTGLTTVADKLALGATGGNFTAERFFNLTVFTGFGGAWDDSKGIVTNTPCRPKESSRVDQKMKREESFCFTRVARDILSRCGDGRSLLSIKSLNYPRAS